MRLMYIAHLFLNFYKKNKNNITRCKLAVWLAVAPYNLSAARFSYVLKLNCFAELTELT